MQLFAKFKIISAEGVQSHLKFLKNLRWLRNPFSEGFVENKQLKFYYGSFSDFTFDFHGFHLKKLRVTDSKYRESLDRFEKSKTLKLCLKNAFREFSSKILFRFSKNLTSSRNSQKTKIHLFTSLNMQKISGKLTKFSVFALKQFTILEHGINLAQKFHLFSI